MKTDFPRPILAGLRVVEVSAYIAAPLCGATLAALGADVIRVDPPGGGIDIERWPLVDGHSLYWAGLNQGKRSVTIDTRTDQGRQQVARLIAAPGEGGGILVTNLPSSTWNSYQELAKLRRDLIMVLITGERSGASAVDYTVNAGLGFPFITGPEQHEGPVNHVLPAWDAMTGFLASTAILAAERHRRLTGEGQLVELCLADVGMSVGGHLGLLAEAQLVEEPRGRFGNWVYGTFGRDFVTRDHRYVIVLALTPRQWTNLGRSTGLSENFAQLAKQLRVDFRKEGDRWGCRAEIADLLAPWIARRDLDDVRRTFDAGGVLWGPYRTFKELVASDSFQTYGSMVGEVEHPAIGRYLATGSPLRFGAAAVLPPQTAPLLGQHTSEVIHEFGLDS